MHLWHAAQRIGVLHTGTVGVGSDDFGVLQELVEGLRHMQVARIGTKLMEIGRKRGNGPQQTFNHHGSGQVGMAKQSMQALYHLYTMGSHKLGAVDQG